MSQKFKKHLNAFVFICIQVWAFKIFLNPEWF